MVSELQSSKQLTFTAPKKLSLTMCCGLCKADPTCDTFTLFNGTCHYDVSLSFTDVLPSVDAVAGFSTKGKGIFDFQKNKDEEGAILKTLDK